MIKIKIKNKLKGAQKKNQLKGGIIKKKTLTKWQNKLED